MRLGGAVDVGDGEAAGVFGRRGAQQAPYGGGDGIGGVVTGRPGGDRHQAGVREAVVGEPCVHGGQDGDGTVVGGTGIDRTAVGSRDVHGAVVGSRDMDGPIVGSQNVDGTVAGGRAGVDREEHRRRVGRGEYVEGRPWHERRVGVGPRGRVVGQYGHDGGGFGRAVGRRRPHHDSRGLGPTVRRRQHGRRPLHPEEAARARGVVADGGQRAQDQSLDVGDGGAGLVGGVQSHRVVGVPGEAGAEGGGADGVQVYAAPQERQPGSLGGVLRQREGVEGGVEQGRVQAEGRGVSGAVRQGGLDEEVVAVPPGGGEAAERGAVRETGGGEPVVQVVQRERFGSGGRPGPQVPGRGGTRGGEGAGGVQCPGRVGGCAVGACVDAHGAAAVGRGRFDGDLDVRAAVFGQDEGRVQGEFGEGAAVGLVACLYGEFDEGGAGHDDASGDRMVGQPGVGVGRQGGGEQDGVGARGAQGGAEQRVADAGEAEAADVGDGAELADDRAIAERLADQRPFWRPGTAFGYHAFVIGALVGEVVRRATGRTLQEVYEERIRAPYGLDFHLGLPEDLEPRYRSVQPMAPTPEQQAVLDATPTGPHTLASIAFNTHVPGAGELWTTPTPVPCARAGLAFGGRCGVRARARRGMYAAAISEIDERPPLLKPDTIAEVGQIHSTGYDRRPGSTSPSAWGSRRYSLRLRLPVPGRGFLRPQRRGRLPGLRRPPLRARLRLHPVPAGAAGSVAPHAGAR
ncbi:hypothetical protein SCHAM137S_09334 [Streptomyces chartreusis]